MLARHDHPAEPPAGHRVRLREAVQHEGALGELEDRPVPPLVAEPMVDLVGDDERPAGGRELRDPRQALGREDGAGRIRGRVDQDGLRARSDPLADRLRTILEAVVLGDPHVDGRALGVADEVRVAGVVRIAQDDLVGRIEKVAEDEEHRRRRSRRDEDLVRRDRDAVGRQVVLGDRLAERQDAEAVRVASVTVLDRLLERLADHRWRLEVRLAELEVDHVDARPLERLRALSHLDREERLDLPDPPREAHPALPALRLARTICHSIPGP